MIGLGTERIGLDPVEVKKARTRLVPRGEIDSRWPSRPFADRGPAFRMFLIFDKSRRCPRSQFSEQVPQGFLLQST